jgi:hypothetical protein
VAIAQAPPQTLSPPATLAHASTLVLHRERVVRAVAS